MSKGGVTILHIDISDEDDLVNDRAFRAFPDGFFLSQLVYLCMSLLFLWSRSTIRYIFLFFVDTSPAFFQFSSRQNKLPASSLPRGVVRSSIA